MTFLASPTFHEENIDRNYNSK